MFHTFIKFPGRVYKFSLIAVLTLLVISFSACGDALAKIKASLEGSGTVTEFKTSDTDWAITADTSWQIGTGLNDEAVLQIRNDLANKYAIIIQESREDFDADFSLSDYTTIIYDNMNAAVDNPEAGEIEAITVNKMDAQLFELTGSVESIKIKYLVATIQSEGMFHQIILWTVPSKYNELKASFRSIIDSYHSGDQATEQL